jgi:hypothetical protein
MTTASNRPILAKPEQFEREATALRLFESAAVQGELAKAKALFAKSPLASDESGRSTIDRATEAIAFASSLYAANNNTVEPFILWATNAEHRWNGMVVPSSGYGLDAPDNVYRSATFDGAGRYRIRGTAQGAAPSQETFVVYRSLPGVEKTMTAGRMDEIAGLKSEDFVLDADGGFTITIDADPANGRPNHLQTPADLHGLHLMVRDSLADWTKELPYELSIERLDDAPPQPRRSDAEMAAQAAQALAGNARFWLNWFETYVHAKPLNEIVPPWRRVQGWGMTQQGRFSLADDEAWLITLDPLGARFFDFQISDPWTKAVEYVTRTGSFNASQAHLDDDGCITLVASPKDPGVWNWLDTGGLTSGTFQVRWQSLPASAQSEKAVRDVRVVKLEALASLLPKGARFVTPEQRVAQQRERAASYSNRLR